MVKLHTQHLQSYRTLKGHTVTSIRSMTKCSVKANQVKIKRTILIKHIKIAKIRWSHCFKLVKNATFSKNLSSRSPAATGSASKSNIRTFLAVSCESYVRNFARMHQGWLTYRVTPVILSHFLSIYEEIIKITFCTTVPINWWKILSREVLTTLFIKFSGR